MKKNLIKKSYAPEPNENIIVCCNWEFENEVLNIPFNENEFIRCKEDIGVWKIKTKK